MSVMSVLCVNLVTANMLLSLFFLSGVVADCTNKTGLFITAPKKMETLSGSCLQIPCNFSAKSGQEFNSSREIFGVWIKSDPKFKKYPNNVIFNSSQSANTNPMKITGNLREKNCTTLYSRLITSYTNRYYLRIEADSLKATAVCDPLQITVKDSPRRPTIEISGDLKEKESVTITCSAFTPCPHSPPKLTWNLQQDSHNKIEENTDGTFTTKIQETITLSDQHDGYNISCSATYPVNEGKHVKTAEETKTLSVSCNTTRSDLENSVVWGSALGGIVVVILICLAVCVWWFQTKHQTTQQTESRREDELVPQLPSSIAAENIHYGEIVFSKRRPEPSSDSLQDSGQQQDTVYAQVNVSVKQTPRDRLLTGQRISTLK